jgi:hypothetical protein
MPHNRPESAATDVSSFLTDLDAGLFEVILSKALSEVAAATIDHNKVGEVSVKFKFERIAGTHQVRLQHDVKFMKPTSMGKAGEETSGATVLHVGKFGALSLAQPSLLEKSRQQSLG